MTPATCHLLDNGQSKCGEDCPTMPGYLCAACPLPPYGTSVCQFGKDCYACSNFSNNVCAPSSPDLNLYAVQDAGTCTNLSRIFH